MAGLASRKGRNSQVRRRGRVLPGYTAAVASAAAGHGFLAWNLGNSEGFVEKEP